MHLSHLPHRSIVFARTLIGLILLAVLFTACDRPDSSSLIFPTQPGAAVVATQASLPASISGCTAPAALTPAQTEGPYFKAGSPERASLIEASTPGTKLVLTGYVVTTNCKPIAHALIEFWQADAKGNYDNNGYTLRGHQYTDANGRYELTTIVPGLYPGRTEHIHFKAQAPNGPTLTSQFYFPGVTQNESDGIFDPKLLLDIEQTSAGLSATYIIVTSEK